MIDEVKLRVKKDEEINYMLSELLQKGWTTFKHMLTHVIHLIQCGLHRDVQYAFIKLLKIWFDFHHVRVVAHEMTMEGRERLDLRRGEVKGKKKENM
jgi:hypothetical protein